MKKRLKIKEKKKYKRRTVSFDAAVLDEIGVNVTWAIALNSLSNFINWFE